MRVQINLRVEEPEGEEQMSFQAEFGDGPLPREGEWIGFDLEHSIIVERVQHTYLEGAPAGAPEVWLFCVRTPLETKLGFTVQTYRRHLAKFPSITLED